MVVSTSVTKRIQRADSPGVRTSPNCGVNNVNATMSYNIIVKPVLRWMEVHGVRDSPNAHRMLLSIQGQETDFRARLQSGGPARGLWQFERLGVLGVYQHPTAGPILRAVADELLIERTIPAIHDAIHHQDHLACALARLLLWTDPKPLPSLMGDGWAYYLRNWRPGKPHPDAWASNWNRASALMDVRSFEDPDRDLAISPHLIS